MSLSEDYEAAKKRLFKNKTVVISHQQRLSIYGLFRQAETGDCGPLDEKLKNNVIAYQKWLSHNKIKGMTSDEAKAKYIELVSGILDGGSKGKVSSPPPKLPPLRYPREVNASLADLAQPAGRFSKFVPSLKPKAPEAQPAEEAKKQGLVARISNTLKSTRSVDSVQSIEDEALPNVDKPSIANEDKSKRASVFRSRNFSSVAGLTNPLAEDEDIERKYEIYEKLRAYFAKVDPERIKNGLGVLVDWTMKHGMDKLNENLKKKYGKDLKDLEKVHSKRISVQREQQNRRRTTQMMLSRRLLVNSDAETKKKMDKLTRFLLVNDPELVSRGMYLMVKFIEAKGLGALNENLKKNYGKSLDGVSEDELNAELKKKYGNDLDMLKTPLFEGDGAPQDDDDASALQQTLKEQIQNIDHEKLRQTNLSAEQERQTRLANGNTDESPSPHKSRRSKGTKRRSKKKQVPMSPPTSPGPAMQGRSSVEREYMETLTSKPRFMDDFAHYEAKLQQFLERYEPYRYDEALKLMSNFMKKNGVRELNKKLTKKYQVNLDDFQDIKADVTGDLSDAEFDLKLLQFVNKHERQKNVERAVNAMTEYRKRHGIAALNTKLYMKYGETLNDLGDGGAGTTRQEAGLSMAEMTEALPADLKTKLKSYYAKYDPMILGGNGVDRIFEWAERNGKKALDKQLRGKYKESLSDFIAAEQKLKRELEEFYRRVDSSKLGGPQVDSVLAWAMLNGRDALNFNLRKKYDEDLDTALRNSRSPNFRA